MTENVSKNMQRPSSTSELALRAVQSNETATDALKEMIIPFVLSGFGNMGAGIIQGTVTTWDVFVRIPQLFSLITPLLGLKGNLAMTLSSRLSTHANLGRLKDPKIRNDIFAGNLSLVQLQASVIGLFTPLALFLIDFGMSSIRSEVNKDNKEHEEWTWAKYVLITGSCVITTNIASIILGVSMCFVIYVCKVIFNINPDNVASPIAASVGDIITMGLLALLSNYLYGFYSNSVQWIAIGATIIFALLTPYWGLIAYRNKYTRNSIFSGFTPIVIAVGIQAVAGTIMKNAIIEFTLLSSFQSIINGFGGDLVAVLCSRLSTHLHKTTVLYKLPESEPYICVNPCSFFCSRTTISRFALFLVLIAFPSQIPFLLITIHTQDHSRVTAMFFILYGIASTTQVIIVLYTAFCFVQLLWSFGCDPDDSSIPVMTAFADLLGSILLLIVFIFLKQFEDPNSIKLVNSTNIGPYML